MESKPPVHNLAARSWKSEYSMQKYAELRFFLLVTYHKLCPILDTGDTTVNKISVFIEFTFSGAR